MKKLYYEAFSSNRRKELVKECVKHIIIGYADKLNIPIFCDWHAEPVANTPIAV